jgi:hypothetical protein
MIAITTEKGTLRVAAEFAIPNGQSWGPTRIERFMAHIEQFVFAAEEADRPRYDPPDRKGNFRSGLVVVPENETHA